MASSEDQERPTTTTASSTTQHTASSNGHYPTSYDPHDLWNHYATHDAYPRFQAWVALTIFSAVCLAAETSEYNSTLGNRSQGDNGGNPWVFAVLVLSVVFGGLAVAAHFIIPSIFANEIPELVLVVALLVMWGTGLPILMNPENDIAVTYGPVVLNANLYFFSWASFGTVLWMVSSLARHFLGLGATTSIFSTTPLRWNLWYGITASSLVAMGSAVRIYRVMMCNVEGLEDLADPQFCRKTKFSIVLSVLTFILSEVILIHYFHDEYKSITIELIVNFIVMAMWCAGVGVITLGDNAPGSTIGNLFFATWITFGLAVTLFGHTTAEFLAGGQPGAANTSGENDTDQAVPPHQTTPPNQGNTFEVEEVDDL